MQAKPRCKHNKVLCVECTVVTDAAKRIHDAIGLAVTFHDVDEVSRSWMAFALSDGATDNTLYPSKQAAMDGQLDENRYCYIWLRVCLGGIPLKDAQLFLDASRHAHDAGMRLTDPAKQIVFPQGRDQLITRPTFQPERGYVRPWQPGREYKP